MNIEVVIGRLIIIGLALAGLYISYYIYSRKNKDKKMVCLIGHDCGNVVNSKYGKTFGFQNSFLGMLYFSFIAFVYIISLYLPIFELSNFVRLFSLFLIFGLAFSVYLTFIQIFALKELCIWCLASAAINLVIFIIFAF